VTPAPLLATNASQQIMLWCALLLVVAIIGFLLVLALKRWQSGEGASAAVGPLFSISELRKLRDQGQISDEEFERARAAIIGQAGAGETASAEPELGPELLPDKAAPAADVDKPEGDDPPVHGGESTTDLG
jgi:hypothetical protein